MAEDASGQVEQRRPVQDRIAAECGVIRRAAWGAKPPVGALEPDWDYDSIVVHYTGHDTYPDMKSIQVFDIEHRHWADVAYHYAIAADGRIFEGRELVWKGSHVRLQNTGRVGIVCMGDFDSGIRNWLALKPYDGDPVQPAMLAALRRLSGSLIRHFPIRVFGGHMEFGDSATCPGSHLLPKVQAMRAELGRAAPMHRSL